MNLQNKLTKPIHSVLQYFGITDSNPQKRQPVSLDLSEHRYPSFAELLPYKYYDESSQVFFNETNAGLLYRMTPLTGGNESLAESLDSIIRTKIEDKYTLQVIKVVHNQVAPKIERFADQFKLSDLKNLSRIGDSLESYYKKASVHGFKTKDGVRTRLTHAEVYVVVDIESDKKSETELKVEFGRFQVSFQAALNASSIGFELCDAVDLLHLIYFYTHHNVSDIYPKAAKYDEESLLKYQITDADFMLSVDEGSKDSLLLSGSDSKSREFETEISVLTLDKPPASFQLWDNINNSSNIFNTEYSIQCNHIISVIYKVDDHAKALRKANRTTRDLSKKANSAYASLVPGTEERAQQWKGFRDDLAKQKTSSCKMLYNVVLFSKPGNRHEDLETTKNTFSFNGLKLSSCKYMQMPYFLASMPFLFTGNLQKDFALPMMMHHISSWNATQYLPLLSDWQGQQSGILLPSMRGQTALIDPFSGYFGTNFNASVTGTSGAGKSFLMQMLSLSTLFDGGNVYIIDIGGSYRKLCEAVGGIYLEYDNLAMNPFTYIDDVSHHIDDLIDLFELLACPKRGASDNDSSALRTAILAAYDKKQNETLIDDVQDALYQLSDEQYPTAKTLAGNIDRYTSQAEHGRAFNQSSKLDPSARFIVIDLEQIKDKKSVIAPALLSVFSQFRKRIYDADRSIKKLCLVDEAWKFFEGDPRAIEFLVEGFRTGRRYKASFITITQGVADYFNFSEARQLWDNASLKIVLRQDPTMLNNFNKEYELFSEYEMEILKKFPMANVAGYSQLEVIGGNFNTFQRLFVDPFTLVMLSSAGDDYTAVQNLKAQGVPFLDAVDQVAQAHYGDLYANA